MTPCGLPDTSKSVYPNLLVVNETAYAGRCAEEQDYRDITGKALNLTERLGLL